MSHEQVEKELAGEYTDAEIEEAAKGILRPEMRESFKEQLRKARSLRRATHIERSGSEDSSSSSRHTPNLDRATALAKQHQYATLAAGNKITREQALLLVLDSDPDLADACLKERRGEDATQVVEIEKAKLRKLRIERVDLVTAPANPGAWIKGVES